MSKRRLTKQQLQRIQVLQEGHLRKMGAVKKPTEIENELGEEQTGLIAAHYGKFIGIIGRDERYYRCNIRQNLETLVVGDNVIFRAAKNNKGVVIALLPRKSLLWRPNEKNQPKPIAANIDQILIVIALEPEPTPLLIDSYLVAAQNLDIQPLLLLNKVDLLPKLTSPSLLNLLATYSKIGYPFIKVCALPGQSLSQLSSVLENHTSIFVGQSGVGQSSLIQNLIPQADIPIGELSIKSGLGTHKTTTARLYRLPGGINIIDSPGIRDFKLAHLPVQRISKGFKEFQPFLSECKFKNCTHISEPECGVLNAVTAGKIAKTRLQSYQTLLKAIKF